MKKYDVSLVILADKSVGEAFFKKLGVRASNLSRRETAKGMLWRIAPPAAKSASLLEQIRALAKAVPFDGLDDRRLRAYLSVGVFFDTATCSVELPPEALKLLQGTGITVEITCYPTVDRKNEIRS